MNPRDLVAAAKTLALTPNRRFGSTRFLMSALLMRQALEDALDLYWLDTVPGLERCSARAQLVSLPFYTDAGLAAEVTYCWHRLSGISHHHAYELPAGSEELTHLGAIVTRFLDTTPDGSQRHRFQPNPVSSP
jgi:hypothetical protein